MESILVCWLCEKGIIASKGRIVRSGQVFGQEVVYGEGQGRREFSATCLTNCVVLSLHVDNLNKVLEVRRCKRSTL